MKKCLVIPFILISLMMIPKTTHASDYIESVKNYANDMYIRRYKNDYDFYVLGGQTYLHAENTTGSTTLQYYLCFFNKDTTVNVSNNCYIKTCPKLVRIGLDISNDKSERLSSREITGQFSDFALLTNYYDKEDTNSSTGGVSSKIDIEELKPYFILVSFFICLCFLGIVWRRR